MKKLRLILPAIALMASAATFAADKLLIIEGHFFSELPVAVSEITGMSMISTPTGVKATGITLAHPLPEEALRYALPADSVPEAAQLLERSAEARVMALSVSKEEKIKVGDKFPQFTATDIDGATWTSADVARHPMVLNLWFTGCGPCRAEMPELSTWKDEMPSVLFFSATYEDPDRARPVIQSTGFNWIHLVNDTQFRQWIGGQGYPMTIVVDAHGTITHIEYGTSPLQREALKKQIQAVAASGDIQ